MNEEFVNWLIAEINNRGWSNSELARRANLSQSTVSMITSYKNNPGIDFCTGIAKAFSLPAETVLRRAGLLPDRPEATPGLRELNYLYDQLREEDQEAILTLLRGYVREKLVAYKIPKNHSQT